MNGDEIFTFISNVGYPAVMNELFLDIYTAHKYCRKSYCSLHESFMSKNVRMIMMFLSKCSLSIGIISDCDLGYDRITEYYFLP